MAKNYILLLKPKPTLNLGSLRPLSPASQVATASSVEYFAQRGCVITPALDMTCSTLQLLIERKQIK
ncbi:MAG: hypothetical protein VW809_04805 [Deltaproteobacteria bacterium]|nr:hypothetical protein [SAR324 cluster bacterium]